MIFLKKGWEKQAKFRLLFVFGNAIMHKVSRTLADLRARAGFRFPAE